MSIISEPEFRAALAGEVKRYADVRGVTGPGRSGAIASVYTSHLLGVPWLPAGQPCPDALRPLLVIDTAAQTGATLRRLGRRLRAECLCAVFWEPPRVRFWYEDVRAP